MALLSTVDYLYTYIHFTRQPRLLAPLGAVANTDCFWKLHTSACKPSSLTALLGFVRFQAVIERGLSG